MKHYEMKRFEFQAKIFFASLFVPLALSASTLTVVLAQAPTATPTPQVSPTGVYVTVLGDEPFANIRMGPSSSVYPVVGQLFPGDTAPALGRSPGGDWIQIEFVSDPNDAFAVEAIDNKGWVYSPLVQVSGGVLQIVEPPPTPVPPATATIDPTLAAQFTVVPTLTRLPTFTPPPSLVAPIYTNSVSAGNAKAIPMAVIIMFLGSFGIVSFAGSLFIRRK